MRRRRRSDCRAAALTSLGRVAQVEGKLEEARGDYARALAIREKVLGPEHPEVAYALIRLGEVAMAAGEAGEAIGVLERALRIREASGRDPLNLAEARFALARALWEASVSRCSRGRSWVG